MTANRSRHGIWRAFVHDEAAGGIVLIAAAILALVVANLPATASAYRAILHRPVGPMSVQHWIDDGLMSLFFLLVGLEIKREIVAGRLASAAQRRLPFIAAAAGMIVPALVFLAIAGGEPGLRAGWAIPAATDIAFAIGVLSLLGKRVPPALTLLLTAIAIVDDMGAVAVIALAYTHAVDLAALAGAVLTGMGLYVLNRRGVLALTPYMIGFALLWLLVLLSGVHATIAGIVTAALMPMGIGTDAGSPLHRLERRLHPWVAFGIVPLFGFANAGVGLDGVGFATLRDPLVLGCALGLFAGKQVGIFGAIRIADRLGIAARPAGVGWMQLYGMALVAGIGFTMSLFIGGLAFADPALVDAVKIGVLAGSIASALVGVAVLGACGRRT